MNAVKRLHAILRDVEKYASSPVQQLELRKAIRAVEVKWAPKRKTSSRELREIAKSKPSKRRRRHTNKVVVYKKDTVEMMRQSLPNLFGQGSLRKCVSVHPYRAMDTFWALHKVNVYKVNGRFDVIDALCNIPILAGLTRRGLKKVVAW